MLGAFDDEITQGTTWPTEPGRPRTPIIIAINAEGLWPLLVQRFNDGEKMMASYILATTITHEMMHAWEAAAYAWLNFPQVYGIDDPADIEFCKQFVQTLWVSRPKERAPPSLYFEDDPEAEVGDAYESHVLGGGTWPLGCGTARFVPHFLQAFGGIGLRNKWPAWELSIRSKLRNSVCSSQNFTTFVKLGDVAAMFQQSFWDNAVGRLGMIAVQDALCTHSKVHFGEHVLRPVGAEFNLIVGTPYEWNEVAKLLGRLVQGGNFVLTRYINLLLSETMRYQVMVWRFVNGARFWAQRDGAIQRLCMGIAAIACEVSAGSLSSGGVNDEKSRSKQQRDDFDLWLRLRNDGRERYTDNHSPRRGVSFQRFVEHSNGTFHLRHNRLISKLIPLSAYWTHYVNNIPGHLEVWIARLRRNIVDIQNLLRQLGMLETHLPWFRVAAEVRLMAAVTAFETILSLLERDVTNIHGNWQDLLTTVPMLRSSIRRPYERWYIVARRELLRLHGSTLVGFSQVAQQFWESLQFGSCLNVVQPKTPGDLGHLVQEWPGILNEMLNQERNWYSWTRELDRDYGATLKNFINQRWIQHEAAVTWERRWARVSAGHVHPKRDNHQQPRVNSEAGPSGTNRGQDDRRRNNAPNAGGPSRRQLRQQRRSTPYGSPKGKEAVRDNSGTETRDKPDEPGFSDVPSLSRMPVKLKPQIVEARLSEHSTPLSRPLQSTSRFPKNDRGLDWRQAADQVNKPFGPGQASSSSLTARLVPHSCTVDKNAIDDLYDTITQKLNDAALTGADSGEDTAARRAAADEQAMDELTRSIADGRVAHGEAVAKAEALLLVAQAKAEEEAERGSQVHSGDEEREYSSPVSTRKVSKGKQVAGRQDEKSQNSARRPSKRSREDDDEDEDMPGRKRAREEDGDMDSLQYVACKPLRSNQFVF
ncbi:hypothetical protein HJFPF1_05438 [Paramyrothecium foliicola]|nr:hypothetical protein HJFPF1_05438 [Paramyrothecium foliicola]